jgi:hypothetical protein
MASVKLLCRRLHQSVRKQSYCEDYGNKIFLIGIIPYTNVGETGEVNAEGEIEGSENH